MGIIPLFLIVSIPCDKIIYYAWEEVKKTDYKKIENAAKKAIQTKYLMSDMDDLKTQIVAAIAAAIKEYDEQRKKEDA